MFSFYIYIKMSEVSEGKTKSSQTLDAWIESTITIFDYDLAKNYNLEVDITI